MSATQTANEAARKKLQTGHGIEAPAIRGSRLRRPPSLSPVSNSNLRYSPATQARMNAWEKRQATAAFARLGDRAPTPPFRGVRLGVNPILEKKKPGFVTAATPFPKFGPTVVAKKRSPPRASPPRAKKARFVPKKTTTAADDDAFKSMWAKSFGVGAVAKKAKSKSPAKAKKVSPPTVVPAVAATVAPNKRKSPPTPSNSSSNENDGKPFLPWWRRPLSRKAVADMMSKPGGAARVAAHRARVAAENAQDARIRRAAAATKRYRDSQRGNARRGVRATGGFVMHDSQNTVSSDSENDMIPRVVVSPVSRIPRASKKTADSNSDSGRSGPPTLPPSKKKEARTLLDECRMSQVNAEAAIDRRLVRAGIKKQHAAGAPRVALTLRDILARLKKSIDKHPALRVPDLDGGDKCIANKPAEVLRRCIARMAYRMAHSPEKQVREDLAKTFELAGLASPTECTAIRNLSWKGVNTPERSLSSSPANKSPAKSKPAAKRAKTTSKSPSPKTKKPSPPAAGQKRIRTPSFSPNEPLKPTTKQLELEALLKRIMRRENQIASRKKK